MNSYLVGLDMGTSSVKAALFAENGALLAAARSPLHVFSPEPGWAEQDPIEYWKAACQALKEVLASIDPAAVKAVGLSGQCPSHVLVGADHQPLGRAIIWRDQRAQHEARRLNQKVTSKQALEWLGTDYLGDATTPPARLLWLKEHRPEDWEKAVSILQPKDFIALQLTGRIATDRHSAYCLANPDTGVYNPDYFKTIGIPIEKMPEALRPTEMMGKVTSEASALTGLPPGTQVVIGTIDAYCDNLAGGVIFRTRAVDVAGTSEIVSLGIEHPVDAPGVFPANINNEGYFLCGPTQAGGDTLHWLAKCFYSEFNQVIDFGQMERSAQQAPAGSDGLVFLPYLNGERAPIWDSNARGGFMGLTFAHDRRHCTRSVYEGVAYAIRHILEISEKAVGKQAEEIVICGGGSRSAFWNQVKADVFQRPVKPTQVSETGCLGAAILASVGIGRFTNLKEASQNMILFQPEISPDRNLKTVYENGYTIYRELYPALKPVFSGERV